MIQEMAVTTSAPSPSAAPSANANATLRKVGRNTAQIMALVLLSRVLGIARDFVIAHLFGQNSQTDIYTAAFRVPDILYLLVAGGALASVFIPVFKEYWESEKHDEAWHVFSSVMSVVGIAAALMVVGMEFASVPVTRLLFPKFTEEGVQQTAALSRILLPAQWCFFVGGLMMGTLNARERFLIPAIGPVVYNLGIILGGIALHKQLGVGAMAVGAVFGAFTGNFLLPLWELSHTGTRFRFRFDTVHPGVREFWRNMLPALLGLSLSQLTFWITQTFVGDNGSISALRNAYNMTQAPIGVFAQAFAIVLFPTITALAVRENWTQFRQEVSDGIRRILFLTIPASLLMAVLAVPLFYLYTSKKFGEAEVHHAAAALWCYSLSTFAWSAQSVLARAFYARKNTRTPAVITTAMVALFALLCYVATFVLGFDYLSLAIITSFISTLNMFVFLICLQKQVGGLNIRGMAGSAARITIASVGASAAAYFLSLPLLTHLHHNKLGGAVTLLVAGSVGVVLYAVLCYVLRVPELFTIRQMFRRSKG